MLVVEGSSCSSGSHLSISVKRWSCCTLLHLLDSSIFIIGFPDENEAVVGTDVLKIKKEKKKKKRLRAREST
jgi:hypothetical protein